MMISAPAFTVLNVALYERRSTKLSTPDNKSVIEKTTHLEVLNKACTGLIRIATLVVEFSC